MQYRTMPGSNDSLSVLGYGCMRFPAAGGGKGGMTTSIDVETAKQQVRYAIDQGVNYLDTAWPYHRGNSESFLGEHVLKDGYREKVKLATKLPCYIIYRAERFQEIFDKQLEKLQTDYIDYYLMHALEGDSWDRMVSLGILEWMDRIKASGKVRHMGFSFHGRYDDFIRIVDAYDWDFTQIQYNILDVNFQAGIRGLEYAHAKGLGIIIMEPLRGGSLVGQLPEEVQAIYDASPVQRTTADWAFRWIYNHPAVTLVLSGMNDMEHIRENIAIASDALANSMSPEELETVEKVRGKYLELMQVGCTGCGYCMPCPVGIDIPACFKNLNNAYLFGLRGAKFAHMRFQGVTTGDGKPHWASDCIDCGKWAFMAGTK